MAVKDEEATSNHTRYEIRYSYQGDMGKLLIPVAAPGNYGSQQPAEIVQCSAPYGFLVVFWSATRNRELPVCPHPDLGDANFVFKNWRIEPHTRKLDVNGHTYIYTIEGWYSYLMVRPFFPGEDYFPIGDPPYDDGHGAEKFLAPLQFETGILKPDS